MTQTTVKPTDKALKAYYEQLDAAEGQGARHEGNIRRAFEGLLETTANVPNRADDREYIARLVGRVVAVSVETVRLVDALAGLPLSDNAS